MDAPTLSDDPTSSWSLELVLFLQQWSPHPWLDWSVIGLTLLGDPKLVFLYLAPLVYWLMPAASRRALGIEVLLGLLLSDWLNALLKWPLRGDRPYWHSSAVKEHWVTCESGFGMPSGHVMVSSCVSVILLTRVPARWKRACSATAGIFLILLAASRLYVGSHFPGQVIAGAMCGLTLGAMIVQCQLQSQLQSKIALLQRRSGSRSSFILSMCVLGAAASFVLVMVAVVEFLVLSLFTDPLHSLRLAAEGCEATKAAALASSAEELEAQRQFQVSRGPFMGVMRDAGVAAGAALALALLHVFAVDGPATTSGYGTTTSSSEEAVPLAGAGSQGRISPGTSRHAYLLSQPRLPLSALCLRAFLGLGESYLVQEALALLFHSSGPLQSLAQASPSFFVYAQNWLTFAAITVNYLIIVPILFQLVERSPNTNGDHKTAARSAMTAR